MSDTKDLQVRSLPLEYHEKIHRIRKKTRLTVAGVLILALDKVKES